MAVLCLLTFHSSCFRLSQALVSLGSVCAHYPVSLPQMTLTLCPQPRPLLSSLDSDPHLSRESSGISGHPAPAPHPGPAASVYMYACVLCFSAPTPKSRSLCCAFRAPWAACILHCCTPALGLLCWSSGLCPCAGPCPQLLSTSGRCSFLTLGQNQCETWSEPSFRPHY